MFIYIWIGLRSLTGGECLSLLIWFGGRPSGPRASLTDRIRGPKGSLTGPRASPTDRIWGPKGSLTWFKKRSKTENHRPRAMTTSRVSKSPLEHLLGNRCFGQLRPPRISDAIFREGSKVPEQLIYKRLSAFGNSVSILELFFGGVDTIPFGTLLGPRSAVL